jgi:hypothetical protein
MLLLSKIDEKKKEAKSITFKSEPRLIIGISGTLFQNVFEFGSKLHGL